MALIDCPECQKRVSKLAPTCPHCGRPIASEKAVQPTKAVESTGAQVVKIVFGVIGGCLIVVLFVMYCG